MAEALTKKTIQFELVSPESLLASEEATMVVIPGEAGDFGVLADHAPLLSSIRPGVVAVHLPSGEVKKIFVAGGFADVNGKLCSVLAEEAINVNDLDRAQIEESFKVLEAALGSVGDDAVKKSNILRDMDVARAKLIAG